MATNYPTSVDTPTDPTGTNTMDGVTGGAGVVHATQHTNANDGIVAVQNAVGFTGTFKFQGKLTPTAVKTANYNAVAGDFIPCDTTTSAFTITLPTAPTNGTMIGMKYVNPVSNRLVTYMCGGSDVLNVAGGATSGVLTIKSQSETMQYNSASAIWYLLAGDAPLGQLDLRYAPITGSSTYQAGPLTGDVTTSGAAATLVGTANTESIIRANTLNQMAAPTTSLAMNAQRITGQHAGIVTTDSANLVQLNSGRQPFVASGCVWTADAVGSTRLASMTSGTVEIAGVLLTVAAVTSRTFTASNDTYVDLADNGDGTASITYSTVTNNGTSPALANSGTALNTCRIAIITVGASNIAATGNIMQGGAFPSSNLGAALGSSTVAAGSNGSNITATPLNVASGAAFVATGGWASVTHGTGAANQISIISYATVSSNTLTGVTVLQGSGTVSTGDAVAQYFPVGLTDMLGNVVYNTNPYPKMIGYGTTGNYNSTATAAVTTGLVVPFTIPGTLARQVKITFVTPFLGSSATAGTVLTLTMFLGNALSGGSTAMLGGWQTKVAVTVDGGAQTISAIMPSRVAAGANTAQFALTQGAAGTLTLGATFSLTALIVELV